MFIIWTLQFIVLKCIFILFPIIVLYFLRSFYSLSILYSISLPRVVCFCEFSSALHPLNSIHLTFHLSPAPFSHFPGFPPLFPLTTCDTSYTWLFLFRIVLISLDSGALSVLFALLHFITLPLFRFQRFSFAFPHLVVCVRCVCVGALNYAMIFSYALVCRLFVFYFSYCSLDWIATGTLFAARSSLQFSPISRAFGSFFVCHFSVCLHVWHACTERKIGWIH